MKLTVATANTNSKANAIAFDCIKNLVENNDKVFVVVPDRATLITELSIIESQNSSGTFNLEVITLNTLAEKILKNQKQTLSSFGGQLLIKKILTEKKADLLCFNKMAGNVNFAIELYKTIEQFKSSKIEVSELKNLANNLPKAIKLKLSDIALVWDEYNKIIENGFSDGFSKMSGLANEIKNSDLVKSSTFVFLYFDNATNQALNIFFEILKHSKQTIIALPTANKNQQNESIYQNDVENAVIEFAKSFAIDVERLSNNTQTELEKRLFAFDLGKEKIENKNISLRCATSVEDEIKFCANDIVKKVFGGKRFDDFNIVVCDAENYLSKIESIFKQYKIPFFIDQQISISNHSLIKFINALVNCFVYNFQSDFVLDLVKNYYFCNDSMKICDFQNYVFKFGVEGSMFFSEFKNESAEEVRAQLESVIVAYKNFIKQKDAQSLIEIIEGLCAEFNVEEKTQCLIEELNNLGDVENSKISMQIIDKMNEVFCDIKLILAKSQCTQIEFKNLLQTGFCAKTISLVPIKTNSVFVGDLALSYFKPNKENIVLGASISKFPQTLKDVGIIKDQEALLFPFKNKLDPSISLLKKRALFKAFEICCSCNSLVLSHSQMVVDESCSESLPAVEIKNIFLIKPVVVNKSSELKHLENCSVLNEGEARGIFNNEHNKIGKHQNVENFDVINTLANIFLQDKSNSVKNVFKFKQNNIDNEQAITKLERYFQCPLKHFLTNVLKLKERETGLIKMLDIGNIYHEFAFDFVGQIKNINSKNIKEKSQAIFEKIMAKKDYEILSEITTNKPIINNLKKEVVKIANVLYIYENESLFKPKYLEVGFGQCQTLKAPVLKSSNKVFHLKGKIDRVDVFEDDARVIDYKTGSDKFSLKSIFYGKKIQLISYLICVQENGFNPVGAYYLPLNSKKLKNKFAASLDGITLKDIDTVSKMDVGFLQNKTSKFVKAKLTKDGAFNEGCGKTTLLTSKEIQNLIDYVGELSKNAIKEIEGGNIAPSPLNIDNKSACEYCSFKGMFDCSNVKEREAKSVSKANFDGGENNEQ